MTAQGYSISGAFALRHIGPRSNEIKEMLKVVGYESMSEFLADAVPERIKSAQGLSLPAALDEVTALEALRKHADKNQIWRSYIGTGYSGTITPPVILRNVLENPGWYTAYTPYQAEISQGRMEALLVFQTMVQELTGLDICNASLLDEATAAAEAMTMCHRIKRGKRNTFLVSERCHPQTIAVIQTRAVPLAIDVQVVDIENTEVTENTCGVLAQYPDTFGCVGSLESLSVRAHEAGALVCVATDLLALSILQTPGEAGADIALGSSQRFGVPMGYGGPHAAFLATRSDYQRTMPGRIIGVSKDIHDNPALRMALQTREQHIRRQKATSNICTAQVLLAVIAAMYGVWHGPEGIRSIAEKVHGYATRLAGALQSAGFHVGSHVVFDTVRVDVGDRLDEIVRKAAEKEINFRIVDSHTIVVALDETVNEADFSDILYAFGAENSDTVVGAIPESLMRKTSYMTDVVFHRYRSETEMMRYLHRLEVKDLALNTAMIPLGSCTMKLNAVTEMIPVTWSGFGALHPYAPLNQAQGYADLFDELEQWLCTITGFDAVSLQPNAGSQGEYAGLLTIRAYHRGRGDEDRNICLIPTSAHGTNPASAVMAGMKVVTVKCDDEGNIDVADLKAKALKYEDNLAALMITYPSTHGVFEETVIDICEIIHGHGGQVYLDGANMNAMVGISRPGDLGADVCHLNLHKTFCIPHGGGGPGMGPIGVVAYFAPYLPDHPCVEMNVRMEGQNGPVSAAPWGSPSILPISWAYIAMMGPDGLTQASEVAILNANYIAKKLEGSFPVLYRGPTGLVAHECILDTRPFKTDAGVTVDDIAKRLMDYGFHAPTMSWPVIGTLMVEPTESESLQELDRFIEAMQMIRDEIQDISDAKHGIEASPLRGAPHTLLHVASNAWDNEYSREKAAFPTSHTRMHKYWPTVGRIDNVYGDKNLICTCDAWPTTSE
jgi:glycine dehydrogenase